MYLLKWRWKETYRFIYIFREELYNMKVFQMKCFKVLTKHCLYICAWVSPVRLWSFCCREGSSRSWLPFFLFRLCNEPRPRCDRLRQAKRGHPRRRDRSRKNSEGDGRQKGSAVSKLKFFKWGQHSSLVAHWFSVSEDLGSNQGRVNLFLLSHFWVVISLS